MTAIPTIKVVRDNARGYSIINEADFDADRHVLYGLDPVSSMTDDELRAGIERMTGEKPHHLCKRAKLIELWTAANDTDC